MKGVEFGRTDGFRTKGPFRHSKDVQTSAARGSGSDSVLNGSLVWRPLEKRCPAHIYIASQSSATVVRSKIQGALGRRSHRSTIVCRPLVRISSSGNSDSHFVRNQWEIGFIRFVLLNYKGNLIYEATLKKLNRTCKSLSRHTTNTKEFIPRRWAAPGGNRPRYSRGRKFQLDPFKVQTEMKIPTN
jgi:hypothetical protein